MTTPNETTTVDKSQAVLVSLSFSLCPQSVQLETESREIEEKAGAIDGTVKSSAFFFQKKIGKKTEDGLGDLKSYMGAWKTHHNRLTRLWDGDNVRLLPAVLVSDYMAMSDKFKDGFQEKIDQFVNDIYPVWAADAKERMGSLLDKTGFPTLEKVKARIGYNISFATLSDAEAFKRISIITPDQVALMENVTNERVKKALGEAQAQTWSDVMKPIQHIIDTLSKDKPRLYDSMLGNVMAIVDMVPAFNLENDPKLAELAAVAKEKLGSITTEDLRKSDDVRKATLATATTIINSFTPFARKFGGEEG